MIHGQITRQSASYRQGLVLGLTMAEIMLLLVFCLLIAAGAALSYERKLKQEAIQELEAARRIASANEQLLHDLRNDPKLVELLSGIAGSAEEAKIDEFWRKLIESHEVVEKLQHEGLSTTALREHAKFMAQAEALRQTGLDLNTAAEKIALADSIVRLLADRKVNVESNEDALALLERGIHAELVENPTKDSAGHKWPPIINLSEAGGYYFSVGSAELTADFRKQLEAVVAPRLLELTREYEVDIIEVVGHTDEQPVGARLSNLDRDLTTILKGAAGVNALKPADNAGLGLARAVSVVATLRQDQRLSTFKILPLSGAQLILTNERLTDGTFRGDAKERRRIEIRLRKSL